MVGQNLHLYFKFCILSIRLSMCFSFISPKIHPVFCTSTILLVFPHIYSLCHLCALCSSIRFSPPCLEPIKLFFLNKKSKGPVIFLVDVISHAGCILATPHFLFFLFSIDVMSSGMSKGITALLLLLAIANI